METYICKACNIRFDAKGSKTEWIDAAFGPCSKFTAVCPSCGKECDEYRAPKTGSAENSHHTPHAPACGSCCGACGL